MTLSLYSKKDPITLWRQIQRENFTRIEPLADFLQLSPELRKQVLDRPRFSINVPRRLAMKMAKNTLNDPILRQFVPLEEERIPSPGFVSDPVGDLNVHKTKKLLQKYPGRVLILASKACAMHCRFCFRQNFPYETEEKGFDEELSYISNDPTISEVILSGGDPLSLSDETLENLLQSLDSIPHVKRIRFHSRFPIGIPERIDLSFLNALSSFSRQIYFVIHCNHPRELDEEIASSLKKILTMGIPLLNHSVLLKGVNDDKNTLLELSKKLLEFGIIPYYLNLLDQVEGAGHFSVSDGSAEELLRYVQENTSGFGVPRLAREISGRSSKTFSTSL